MARRSRTLRARSRREGDYRFPDIDDLRNRVRFHPEDGSIRTDGVRMTLVHVAAFASLRREIVDCLGVETARGILTRMGYAAGTIDAELVRRVRAEKGLFESFAVGPQLQSLEGTLRVELLHFDYDPERGRFHAEAFWKNSFEVDCQQGVPSAEPVCWMQAGYACGYTTAFVGKPVLVREIECRGAGGRECRVVGKTVEQWGEDVDDLRFLKPHGLLDARPSRASRRAEAAGRRSRPEEAGEDLVGASPSFHAACHRVRKAASTRATVLFLGETGVGKEMFARFLHRASPRRDAPFVAVNCAAIPETLIEAELFGVERGAFTGAVASRPGRFERADGGTLFLDEIGSMPLAAQAKLLRALQFREIERVGDARTRTVDVRVIAATNENLPARVQDGTFRSDLFYRLNVFSIRLPPLRERRDDIPLLMDRLLEKYCRLHERRISGFTERAVAALLDHDYPGNIRELENMIESAVILSEDDAALDVSLLFASVPASSPRSLGVDAGGHLAKGDSPSHDALARSLVDAGVSVEPLFTAIVEQAIAKAGGNYSKAARLVGLTRAQLAHRAKRGGRRIRSSKPALIPSRTTS